MLCRGKLIVVEGIDGCGKTTQIKNIVEYLNGLGIKTNEIANVTDGPIGKAIRTIIGDPELYVNSIQAACLFMAELFTIDKQIDERINNGEWFVCSRHYYSTLIYGGGNDGVLEDSYQNITDNLKNQPDIVIWLHANPIRIQERITNRNCKEEVFETPERQIKYAERYENMFRNNYRCGARILTIDGNQSPTNVECEILQKLSSALIEEHGAKWLDKLKG